MAETEDLLGDVRKAAPKLVAGTTALTHSWLAHLLSNKDAQGPARDKHVNDPVWGTITLHPWEVALLDTPLVQRLRGVKQLGLAHLVFPSATHDRFSHVCGVVEAVDRMIDAIQRNTQRRKRAGPAELASPDIPETDRYLIRLAALIHDCGHGPFSHTIEPLVERRYRDEIRALEQTLVHHIGRVSKVQVSEAIAVLLVISESFQTLLTRPLMDSVRAGSPIAVVTRRLISAIIGGSDGTARGALGALVSGQVDADKLDYMARDAHHAGLPIDFDSIRLISKLEAVRVEAGVLSTRLNHLHHRVEAYPGKRYEEIGISAGGTGAFEQMLVGRIFLYDRLYHHHKVRTADAMAQRLVHYADPDNKQIPLELLYAPLPDDTVIRAFGGLKVAVDVAGISTTFPSTPASMALAQSILDRALYKRTFAFAGRFIAGLDRVDEVADIEPGLATEDDKDAERSRVMLAVNPALAELDGRLAAEAEIADLAARIGSLFPSDHRLHREAEDLASHHVIIDLARDPHPARITTIARNDDGRLDVPDVFYDPARWADVYATQRRTGYVFAHPNRLAAIGMAARIWFLQRFGCVFDEAADRQAKMVGHIDSTWYERLVPPGLITARELTYLQRPRLVLGPLRLAPIHLPRTWSETNPDFADQFNAEFEAHLPGGLSALAARDLVQTLRAVFRVVQAWAEDAKFATHEIMTEAQLQRRLFEALRVQSLDVAEGTKRSGGETDLLVGSRVVIENKFIKDPTDDPFGALPRTGLQGRRYVLPTGQRFVITAVAFRAASEAGLRAPSHCVRVLPLTDVDEFVEVRIAIRMGDTVPSRAA